MQALHWIHSLFGMLCQSARRRPRGTAPQLECLEDRVALSSGHGAVAGLSAGSGGFSGGSGGGKNFGAHAAALDSGGARLSSGNNSGGSGGGAVASGPGYPQGPATGPALVGDSLRAAAVPNAAVNMPNSDVAIVPVLVAAAPGVSGPVSPISQNLNSPTNQLVVTDAHAGVFATRNDPVIQSPDGKPVSTDAAKGAAALPAVPVGVAALSVGEVVAVNKQVSADAIESTSSNAEVREAGTSLAVVAAVAQPTAASPLPVAVTDEHVWTKTNMTAAAVSLAVLYIAGSEAVRSTRKPRVGMPS